MIKKFFKGLYQIACALVAAVFCKAVGPYFIGDKWTEILFWVLIACAIVDLIYIPFDMLSKQEE